MKEEGDRLEQRRLDVRQEVLAHRCGNGDDGVCVDFALYRNGGFHFEELIVSDRLGVVAAALSSPKVIADVAESPV